MSNIWPFIRDIDKQVKPLPRSAKKAFSGKIFDVWQWEQNLYDGKIAIWERIRRPDAAHVLPVRKDGKIVLVRDEQPDRGSILAPAGGQIDPGEEPREAAQRELLEETGYSGEEFIAWHTYRPSVRTEFLVHAFIARNCTKTAEPSPEPGERIEVVAVSFEELLEIGHDWNFRDLVLRLRFLEAKYDAKKRDELKELLYG